jgi:uncharacterized protein YjbJ (UPF0337 family)
MNKDQIKGKAKKTGGKIQEDVGRALGSSKQQVEGVKNQATGTAQEKLGDLENAMKERGKNR